MRCQSVKLPGGGHAIVCGSRQKLQRCQCGNAAPLLCDWKEPKRRSGTCDKPLCEGCSFSPAPGKDICLAHKPIFDAWRAKRRGEAR